MIDALLFICTLIIFLDYFNKSFLIKDKEDPITKKWIAEIEADKRREKFFDEDKR
jgi:hypothetical protein|tara:strand:- start:218 stop:382 length:165 start_codon:yes stop_codon:yes gene_type:complete